MTPLTDGSFINSLLLPFLRKGKAASFCLPGAVGEQTRVLCIDPGDLSEVLFHLPVLTAIRRKYPACQFDFLLPENHVSLVVPSGLARQCLLYKEGQLSPWRPAFASLLRRLGAGGYDLAVVMSFYPQPRLELAALASGAPLRLGPSHPDAWPAVNLEVRPDPGQSAYLGDRMRALAPFLGFAAGDMDPRWPLPADKIRHIAQQVHFHMPNPEQLLIGLDPGGGKSGFAISLDNLDYLARQLSSQLVCRILPLGLPAELERAQACGARLGSGPLGLPRETLLDMALLLTQCDLFLAGNTDFFHLAVALGVPAVGLFSRDEPQAWVPAGRPHVEVLRLAGGEKVDLTAFFAAVNRVTRGRSGRPWPLLVDPAIVSASAPPPSTSPGPGAVIPAAHDR